MSNSNHWGTRLVPVNCAVPSPAMSVPPCFVCDGAAGGPQNLVPPSILGAPVVGESVTADPGEWEPSEGLTFTYQWFLDGEAIPGADTDSYEIQPGDVDGSLTVRVIATDSDGKSSAPATSAPVIVPSGPVLLEAPEISGTPAVGETLTTTTGIWTGTGAITYTYQWLRDGVPVDGEDEESYTLTALDNGAEISVIVTATDDNGSSSAPSNALLVGMAPENTSLPTIMGVAAIGETLTATLGTWAGTLPIEYVRQWNRDGTPIPGAQGTTYVITEDDLDADITVSVTAVNDYGSETATSTAVTPTAAPVNVTPPVISGTPTVGETLTASTGTWFGTAPISYAYQWNLDGSPVMGEEASSYVVQSGDLDGEITVTVTATNSEGSDDATSASVTVTAAPLNLVPPVISGTPAVGETLTASTGTWFGTAPISYAYQWYVDGAPATGAVTASYIVQAGDIDKDVTVVVTATNSVGSDDAESAPLYIPSAPVNVIAPTISGTPAVGQQLTASTGTWVGTPPITYAYQWTLDGDPIEDADGPTYTLDPLDEGGLVSVTVTATNGLGSDEASAVGVTVGSFPQNTVAPAISGTPAEGETLSVTDGTWTGTAPVNFTRQWLKNGNPIPGASGTTYEVQSGDVGAVLMVVVTGTNALGSDTANSNTVTILAEPQNTVAPSISGTPQVGATLTANDGTWTGSEPITYTYQWQRSPDGDVWEDIEDATNKTYVPTEDDVTP